MQAGLGTDQPADARCRRNQGNRQDDKTAEQPARVQKV
jgi:hypothetical protein